MKTLFKLALTAIAIWAIYTFLNGMVFIDPSDIIAKAIILTDNVDVALDLFNSGASTLTVEKFNVIMEFKSINGYAHLDTIYSFLTTSVWDKYVGMPLADLVIKFGNYVLA